MPLGAISMRESVAMFAHLLVPLDGSPFAEVALKAAVDLADKYQSRLLLVYVVNVPHAASAFADEAHDQLLDHIRHRVFADALAYLEAKEIGLRQQGYRVASKLIEGQDVADTILEIAREELVDTIVMCTHGRSGIGRWVFGSVAEKVLRGAEIPLLLLRPESEGDA